MIEGQVLNAQYAEESYQLKRENNNLKKQLEEQKSIQSSDFLVDSNENEVDVLRETVQRLLNVTICLTFLDLTLSAFRLFLEENRRLQSTPQAEIAMLQEELTLVKMRDAEAQVNLNELRQRLADLNREWLNHEQNCQSERDVSNDAYDIIAHELISLKMREAQIDCDNKLLQQKIMDIETQKQVLHNQIKRQDEEIHRLKTELDQCRAIENDLRSQYNELKRQISDGELRVGLIFRVDRTFLDQSSFFSKKKIR